MTRMAPSLAVAYWVTVHSAQLGAQMPMRSPLASPTAINARASRSTSAPNAAYVHRMPWARSISASRSPKRAIVASRLAEMVPLSSAGVVSLCVRLW